MEVTSSVRLLVKGRNLRLWTTSHLRTESLTEVDCDHRLAHQRSEEALEMDHPRDDLWNGLEELCGNGGQDDCLLGERPLAREGFEGKKKKMGRKD